MSEDYVPYGDEWAKEMMKWRKDHIVALFAKAARQKNEAEAEANRLRAMLAEADRVIDHYADDAFWTFGGTSDGEAFQFMYRGDAPNYCEMDGFQKAREYRRRYPAGTPAADADRQGGE